MTGKYLTITQAAKTAKVTKQYLYQQFDRKLQPYAKVVDGKKYLDSAFVEVIQRDKPIDFNNDNQLIITLQKQVVSLENQLRFKDEELQEKNRQIAIRDEQVSNLLNTQAILSKRLLALEDRRPFDITVLENADSAAQETGTAADQEPNPPKEPEPPTAAATDQEQPEATTEAAEPDQTPTAPAEPSQQPLQAIQTAEAAQETIQATAAPSQEPLHGTQAADTHSQAVEPSQATDTPSQEAIQATQQPEPQEADKPSLWARFLAFLGF